MLEENPLTTATRAKRTTAPAPQRVSNDAIREALEDYRNRVLHRLSAAPRFQSIGRQKYVFVGDVDQALDVELYGGQG